jgi:hypothetical protein
MNSPAQSLPVTVRNAFSSERGTYRAIVDEDGSVRVYDSVAGHYTTCHALTPAQVASARRRAGWRNPAALAARVEVARRVLDRAEEAVAKRRGWSTPRQADHYAAAVRRRDAALARLEKLDSIAT